MKQKFKISGTELLAIRHKNKLTQKELGETLGVHAQFISNAERGLCSLPKYCFNKMDKVECRAYLYALLSDKKLAAEFEIFKQIRVLKISKTGEVK